MRLTIIARIVPWARPKERARQRIAELRARDGDDCRRCRRPLRFDLTDGHDLGPKIERAGDDKEFLTHRRCNPSMVDHTSEVLDRVRRKAEADLLSAPRRRKRA